MVQAHVESAVDPDAPIVSLAEIARIARLASAGTIPEAIRRLKRLAPTIGANGFALFFAGRGFTTVQLMHCFDESFPARSPTAAVLGSKAAEVLSHHLANSSLPLVWGMQGHQPFFERCEAILPDLMGLALPVHADPIHSGIFVFTGADLAAPISQIEDLHSACFEIFASVAQVKSTSNTSASSISKRELECLMLTAAGHTSEGMARVLGLSVHTANQYLTSAASKLDAVNRTQAVAKAIRLGLIE